MPSPEKFATAPTKQPNALPSVPAPPKAPTAATGHKEPRRPIASAAGSPLTTDPRAVRQHGGPGSRVCENSGVVLESRISVSISEIRKPAALTTSVRRPQQRKQFSIDFAQARFHTPWVIKSHANMSAEDGSFPRKRPSTCSFGAYCERAARENSAGASPLHVRFIRSTPRRCAIVAAVWRRGLPLGGDPELCSGDRTRGVPSMLEGSAVSRPIALDAASASSARISCRDRRGCTKVHER
jgi:hypothetical protein